MTLGFRLQERLGFLEELAQLQRLGLGIAGHHIRRKHLDCHSLDDPLAGSRLHILAAGEDLL